MGILGLLAADRFSSPPVQPLTSASPASPGADNLVEDPVTGERFDPARAFISLDLYGKTFHFASRSSLERFREDPLKYVAPRVKFQVRVLPQGEGSGTGASAGGQAPVPADSGTWEDASDPPPPMEAQGSEPAAPAEPAPEPGGQEQAAPPAEPPAPTEQGGPGWLPDSGSGAPTEPSAGGQAPPAPGVGPGDPDVILDEKTPGGR